MTLREASERYQIPVWILREYESWGLCGADKKTAGVRQYDDADLKHLSVIMTLHDIGFTAKEVEVYMRLLLEQPRTEELRLKMLDDRRAKALDEIHFKERQLCRLDCLRHEIRKKRGSEGETRR